MEPVAQQRHAQIEIERRHQHPGSQRDSIKLCAIAVGEFCRRVRTELQARLGFVLEHVDELLARCKARRAVRGPIGRRRERAPDGE